MGAWLALLHCQATATLHNKPMSPMNTMHEGESSIRRFGQARSSYRSLPLVHSISSLLSSHLSSHKSTISNTTQAKMPSQLPTVDLQTPMKDPKTSFAEMIKTISTQESQIRFTQFNAQVAFELGSKIRELFFQRYPDGQQKGLGLVIRVELFNGLRLLECVVGDGPVTAPANL